MLPRKIRPQYQDQDEDHLASCKCHHSGKATSQTQMRTYVRMAYTRCRLNDAGISPEKHQHYNAKRDEAKRVPQLEWFGHRTRLRKNSKIKRKKEQDTAKLK